MHWAFFMMNLSAFKMVSRLVLGFPLPVMLVALIPAWAYAGNFRVGYISSGVTCLISAGGGRDSVSEHLMKAGGQGFSFTLNVFLLLNLTLQLHPHCHSMKPFNVKVCSDSIWCMHWLCVMNWFTLIKLISYTIVLTLVKFNSGSED